MNQTKQIALFKNNTSFKEVAEQITAPMKEALASAFEVINNDPLMRVSSELEWLNTSVWEVYDNLTKEKSLVKKTLAKIPYVSDKLEKQTFTDTKLRLNLVFNWFDTVRQSIEASIWLQKNYAKWINTNLDSLHLFQEWLKTKLSELTEKIKEAPKDKTLTRFKENVVAFDNNLTALKWHLILAKESIQVKLDSAEKLALSMSMSEPILSALMGNAIISNATQKTADACINIMSSMSTTLDNMSTDLTNKAIKTSEKANTISTKPLLSSEVLALNVAKIQEHFQVLDSNRATCLAQWEAERKQFKESISILWKLKQLQLK